MIGITKMKRLLTDAKLRNLKPQNKSYKETDGGGLYVFITKSGAKSFRYDCKLYDKRFTLTLGQYPEISLADARERHEIARALLAKGIDPRVNQGKTDTIEKFSFYALENLKRTAPSPSTEKKKLSRLKKYLFPYLDKRPLNEVTTVELLKLIKPIALKGNIETARRLAMYCRQIFNDLIALQLIQNNPADRLNELLPALPEAKNLAHKTDPFEFSILLNAIDNYQGDIAVKQAIKLAPLVFLRPHNIRFLRWEYIDFKKQIIIIPANEMKMSRPHKVPLSKQSVDILETMRPITGEKNLVFIAGNRDKALSENTLNKALQRVKHPKTGEPLGKGFSTSHGLRHTASTLLNELGYNSDAIELQLAHLDKDRIRRTYNKAELLPERTKMMQEWADYLDELKIKTSF